MRRRITSAIMSVAGLIVLTLGIPLAIVAHRSILRSEVVRVQATVARSLAEITTPIDVTQLAAIANERDAPPPFSVYTPDGARVFGEGPQRADAAVIAALRGAASTVTEGAIIIASPITDSADERVVGVLRISRSLDDVDARTRRDWLVMAAAALVVLGGGWIVASRLARRLAEPASALAEAAASLGHGGVIERPATTGVPELDALGGALWESSQRINEALGRERQFSADVSHQLRTPLTGLRLTLESSRDAGDPRPAIDASLAELDRIEATVSHLLEFARDAIPTTATANLAEAVDQSAARWGGRVAAAHRALVHRSPPPIIVQASSASIDQILDVLVDNALQHGTGTITVSPRPISGGVAVDVSDEGSDIVTADRDRIFQRGQGSHHGIGLALARSIAEAEGGRLILHRTTPTTFSLILLTQERNTPT